MHAVRESSREHCGDAQPDRVLAVCRRGAEGEQSAKRHLVTGSGTANQLEIEEAAKLGEKSMEGKGAGAIASISANNSNNSEK